jgi:hypothetical protein
MSFMIGENGASLSIRCGRREVGEQRSMRGVQRRSTALHKRRQYAVPHYETRKDARYGDDPKHDAVGVLAFKLEECEDFRVKCTPATIRRSERREATANGGTMARSRRQQRLLTLLKMAHERWCLSPHSEGFSGMSRSFQLIVRKSSYSISASAFTRAANVDVFT